MRDPFIRLGPSQLVIVGFGLLTVLFVAYEAEGPLWNDAYARAYALPRMEERWGFRFGTFRVKYDGREYEDEGIVRLAPDGRLARLGLRQHDMPGSFGTHSPPPGVVLYRALLASGRGEATEFKVANIDDWAAGRDAVIRDINLQPAR